MLILNQRILHLGEWCTGPVEGWNSLEIYLIVTARQGGNRVPVIAVLKAEDAKV
jgi:hypothetical protein